MKGEFKMVNLRLDVAEKLDNLKLKGESYTNAILRLIEKERLENA